MISVGYPAGKAGQIVVIDGLLTGVADKFIARMQYHWNHSFPGNTLGGVDTATKLTEDLHFNPNANISLSFMFVYFKGDKNTSHPLGTKVAKLYAPIFYSLMDANLFANLIVRKT